MIIKFNKSIVAVKTSLKMKIIILYENNIIYVYVLCIDASNDT